jgi:hypothetical protein
VQAAARNLVWALAAGIAAALAGCASRAPASPGADRYPDDFSIDATLLVGLGAPESLRAEEQQAKYQVLPDGSLLADASPFLDISTRPGRARWLYEEQVQWLWSTCSQAGFLQEADANGPPNPDLLEARRGERLAVLTFRAEGRTWTFVRRARGEEPLDPAAARLLRSLAILAWMPDFRAEELAPERYDYGPDPYELYRAIREKRGVETVK